MKKNEFAVNFFMALFLIFNYIKKNISNISLVVSALLILRYLAVVYSFDIMTIGIAIMLLIVSLTTSLPKDKENIRHY